MTFGSAPRTVLSVRSISLPSCGCQKMRLSIARPYVWNGCRRSNRLSHSGSATEKTSCLSSANPHHPVSPHQCLLVAVSQAIILSARGKVVILDDDHQ